MLLAIDLFYSKFANFEAKHRMLRVFYLWSWFKNLFRFKEGSNIKGVFYKTHNKRVPVFLDTFCKHKQKDLTLAQDSVLEPEVKSSISISLARFAIILVVSSLVDRHLAPGSLLSPIEESQVFPLNNKCNKGESADRY